MDPAILFLLLIAGAIALAIWVATSRTRRRGRLMAAPLPAEWKKTIAKDFPRFHDLPTELQPRLAGVARVLAEEKNFEACGGLAEVDERMKALVCLQAAMLIVNLPKHGFYPRLHSILLYPGEFRDRGDRRFGLREATERSMLGESWETGSVVLSWDNVLAGARNADDGLNVVVHEFAHQLDQVNGAADGVPILENREAYRRWAEVFEKNFDELVESVENRSGREPLLDPYGATDSAEFFAVASETFFEEGADLEEEHPDLYAELRNFYGVDPARWGEAK